MALFVLKHLQTLKMNDKYSRRFRINVMTSIFLWWIFVSSVPTFLCLVFKFQLIFHKESTMCIINMSSNCFKLLLYCFSMTLVCGLSSFWVLTMALSEYSFWIMIVYLIICYIMSHLSELSPNYSNSISSVEKPQINVREYRKGNRMWVQKTKTNNTKQTQHKMYLTPLCANKHK